MSEDIDELLYTQEDINEWIRACDELQEVLLDKREEIKNIQSQLDQQKAMWNDLKEWVKKAFLRNENNPISRNDYENVLTIIKDLEQGEKDVKD